MTETMTKKYSTCRMTSMYMYASTMTMKDDSDDLLCRRGAVSCTGWQSPGQGWESSRGTFAVLHKHATVKA